MRLEWCTRRALERWLIDHGFTRTSSKGGHAHYELRGHKVTVVAHRLFVTSNEAMTTVRTLELLGFDRRQVRQELAGRQGHQP